MKDVFRRFAARVSGVMGSAYSFVFAVLIIAVWALTGPIYNFSDTWQLIINTGTTIVTFLMVFLIQNTQNRDTRAIQLKLDELLKGSAKSRNTFIDLEELSDEDLEVLQEEFRKLNLQVQQHASSRKKPTQDSSRKEGTISHLLQSGILVPASMLKTAITSKKQQKK